MGGCAPHTPIPDERAQGAPADAGIPRRAALAHPPTLGFSFCGGKAPTPPSGPAAATQPEGKRVSPVGASPPRPRPDRQPRHSPRASASPLCGLRPHAPVRTGSRDTARGHAHLPCAAFAPTPPLGPAAATQPEGKRVSPVRPSPPRPRSDRQPRHSPRASASPLCGLRPHAPRSDRQPRHSPRASASPLCGLRPHAPARTGSHDTARGQARLPCAAFAPTPPLGPAATTQPEGKRVSPVRPSPPRPRSDRQPRHSPRASASPLCGLRPHAPARTGSHDTARGQARLPCAAFAPTPPLGPAAATAGLEGDPAPSPLAGEGGGEGVRRSPGDQTSRAHGQRRGGAWGLRGIPAFAEGLPPKSAAGYGSMWTSRRAKRQPSGVLRHSSW